VRIGSVRGESPGQRPLLRLQLQLGNWSAVPIRLTAIIERAELLGRKTTQYWLCPTPKRALRAAAGELAHSSAPNQNSHALAQKIDELLSRWRTQTWAWKAARLVGHKRTSS
jgi:hypothetical protein